MGHSWRQESVAVQPAREGPPQSCHLCGCTTDDAGNSRMAGSHSVLHSHRRLGTERGCTGPCWPSCVLTRGTEPPYQVGCSSSAWLFIIPADEGDGAFKVPALSIPLVRSWVLTQKTHRLYSQPSCSWAGWYLRFPC